MRHIDLDHPALAAALADCGALEPYDLLAVAAAVEEGLARQHPDAPPVSDAAFRAAYITVLQWVDRVRFDHQLVSMISRGEMAIMPAATVEESRFITPTGAGLARIVLHHNGDQYVATATDRAEAALAQMLEDIAQGHDDDESTEATDDR